MNFDVIVVGGGHAGIEAAYASAKMGSRTLLLTLNLDTIGLMPCNPSIGGVGKGHLVFEVSALGGLMPKLCTDTYLQARMLNTKKGPAVQGLRLQIDKYAYSRLSKFKLEHVENLTINMAMVEEILSKNGEIYGVRTRDGSEYLAKSVIITTGTFLNGLVHIGHINYSSGRQGEEASITLSDSLSKLGLKLGRLKTGTPPRLLRSSIDFSKLDIQVPTNLDYLFEFYSHQSKEIMPCYVAYTNATTHNIIKANLDSSALYSGRITGIGPRYCPSIEAKISRFPDRDSHHVFVEPESLNSEEIYPSGLSTSLPLSVQKMYIRSIKGFEEAIITRPGYAIEYDFVYPDQLKHSLETKLISGLFLAGQINGTTGYEEAAAQGVVAGINAHLKAVGKDPVVFNRYESYIGVMIDDLVTLGVDEPYRMFTARAERRLILRQDNVFLRLTDKAHNLGLIDENLYGDFKQEKDILYRALTNLRGAKNNSELLKIMDSKEELQKLSGLEFNERVFQNIYADIKYHGYLQREEKEIEKAKLYQSLILPALDYNGMPGLSVELQQKLIHHKPGTIAQALLIPGMTPAAISLLIFRARSLVQS